MSLPTDAESLAAFKSPDEKTAAIDRHINNHPLSQKLRADPKFTESRPHLRMPAEIRKHSLTSGTLLGPTKIPVPPLAFAREGDEFVCITYLGTDLCGHVGIVHGGMLATMVDEGLARCCFAALPNRIGVTASLTINYRSPAKAGSYVVLKAKTTKVEGRKAWVEGRIETLGEGEEPGTVLVEATGLFVEPKYAAVGLIRFLLELERKLIVYAEPCEDRTVTGAMDYGSLINAFRYHLQNFTLSEVLSEALNGHGRLRSLMKELRYPEVPQDFQ